jgi:hypothetical protein
MSFKGRTGVSMSDLAKYDSSKDQLDSIFSPLYDYQTYATAGALNFNFFALPQGQGATSSLNAAGVKTIADTNMQIAGSLPAGNRFLVIGIEVEFFPGSTPGLRLAAVPTDAQFSRNWDDCYNVLRSGSLTLTVQNRTFAQDAPLLKFPTQTRLAGVASYNQNDSNANTVGFGQIEYASAAGAAYDITPVLLKPTQAFSVVIAFPAVVATPSTVDARIGVRLVGKLIRNVQ